MVTENARLDSVFQNELKHRSLLERVNHLSKIYERQDSFTFRSKKEIRGKITEATALCIDDAIAHITNASSDLGFDYSDYSGIRIVVEEFIRNALLHGVCNEDKRGFYFAAYVDYDDLIMHVSDEGNGFNVKEILYPTTSEYSAKPNTGKGILKATFFANEIVYNEKGNHVMVIRNSPYVILKEKPYFGYTGIFPKEKKLSSEEQLKIHKKRWLNRELKFYQDYLENMTITEALEHYGLSSDEMKFVRKILVNIATNIYQNEELFKIKEEADHNMFDEASTDINNKLRGVCSILSTQPIVAPYYMLIESRLDGTKRKKLKLGNQRIYWWVKNKLAYFNGNPTEKLESAEQKVIAINKYLELLAAQSSIL